MNYTINLLRLYDGKGFLIALYMISWVLIVVLEKKKENKVAFAFSAWYLPLMIFNPLVGMLLERFDVMPERMVRIYWLVPVVWVIAYGLTLLVDMVEKKLSHGGVWTMVAISMVLILIGVPLVTEDNFIPAQNAYKLPQETIDVVDLLNADYAAVCGDANNATEVSDSEKTNGAITKMAVLPEAISTYARVYDGTWKLAYGRTPETGEGGDLYYNMGQLQVDVSYVTEAARDYGCSYLVLDTRKELINMPKDDVLFYLGQIDGYDAYRIIH